MKIKFKNFLYATYVKYYLPAGFPILVGDVVVEDVVVWPDVFPEFPSRVDDADDTVSIEIFIILNVIPFLSLNNETMLLYFQLN